jgi:hypothetical protein
MLQPSNGRAGHQRAPPIAIAAIGFFRCRADRHPTACTSSAPVGEVGAVSESLSAYFSLPFPPPYLSTFPDQEA